MGGTRNNFPSNDLPSLGLGSAQGATNYGGQGHWAMESYFGRVNYSFNDKYIVQGAFRADGSANFGPENRWGYFPSVSAAWRISEESFLENATWIDEFKVRVEQDLPVIKGMPTPFLPHSAHPVFLLPGGVDSWFPDLVILD